METVMGFQQYFVQHVNGMGPPMGFEVVPRLRSGGADRPGVGACPRPCLASHRRPRSRRSWTPPESSSRARRTTPSLGSASGALLPLGSMNSRGASPAWRAREEFGQRLKAHTFGRRGKHRPHTVTRKKSAPCVDLRCPQASARGVHACHKQGSTAPDTHSPECPETL